MAEINKIVKEFYYKKETIESKFLNAPEGNFSRVNIFGEISALSEFTEENLYMFYEFVLPLGWKIDNENAFSQINQESNKEEENVNKLKSISQVSTGYVNPNAFSFSRSKTFSFRRINNTHNTHEEELKDLRCYIHNFSLPFELELLGHNEVIGKFDPKILIQINSVDSWGRHRIQGYCFAPIEIKTGNFNIEVPCYKPQEDNYLKIFSYFLGGSRKIPDLKELSKSASSNELNVDTVLNRYGIITEYSGTVHLSINVVIQKKEIAIKAKARMKEKEDIENEFLTKIQSKYKTVNKSSNENTLNLTGQMQTSNHGLINRYGP